MYLSINFVGLLLTIFQLLKPSISGNIIVTHAPEEGPRHLPHLTQLPPSRYISIISAKPVTNCARIYLTANSTYPVRDDFYIFICNKAETRLGVGIKIGGSTIKNNRNKQLSPGGALRAFSVVLHDDTNSVTVENEYEFLVNYTSTMRNRIRNFKYFALSGDAEWETFTDYV